MKTLYHKPANDIIITIIIIIITIIVVYETAKSEKQYCIFQYNKGKKPQHRFNDTNKKEKRNENDENSISLSCMIQCQCVCVCKCSQFMVIIDLTTSIKLFGVDLCLQSPNKKTEQIRNKMFIHTTKTHICVLLKCYGTRSMCAKIYLYFFHFATVKPQKKCSILCGYKQKAVELFIMLLLLLFFMLCWCMKTRVSV